MRGPRSSGRSSEGAMGSSMGARRELDGSEAASSRTARTFTCVTRHSRARAPATHPSEASTGSRGDRRSARVAAKARERSSTPSHGPRGRSRRRSIEAANRTSPHANGRARREPAALARSFGGSTGVSTGAPSQPPPRLPPRPPPTRPPQPPGPDADSPKKSGVSIQAAMRGSRWLRPPRCVQPPRRFARAR